MNAEKKTVGKTTKGFIMRNGKKFLLGLVGIALVMGLVLVACDSVYNVDLTEGETATKTGKAVVTLTDKTYKIEFDGKTNSGAATSETSGTTKAWVWTEGGVGGATVVDSKLTIFTHTSSDFQIAWAGSQAKKSVNGEENAIDFDDIELIILDAE